MLEGNAQSTEEPRTQGTGSPLLGPPEGPGNMQAQGNVASERTTAKECLETVQGPSEWGSFNPFPTLAQVCCKQAGVSGDRECFS